MRNIKTWLGRIITIAALYFVVRFIITNWQSVEFHLDGTSFIYAFLAIVTTSLFFLIRTIGWHQLIKSRRPDFSFTTASWYLAKSEILRYIPGNVWGLSARVLNAEKFSLSKSTGGMLLFEETILLVSSAGILSGFGLFVLHNVEPGLRILGIFLIAGSFLLLLSPKLLHTIGQRIPFIAPLLQESSRVLLARFLKLLPLYLLLWGIFGLSHFFIFKVFFSGGPFFAIMFFSVISWLAGYASIITPSGLGVREVVLGFGLSSYINIGVANAFSIVSRVWYIVIEVVWYALFAMLYKKINTVWEVTKK